MPDKPPSTWWQRAWTRLRAATNPKAVAATARAHPGRFAVGSAVAIAAIVFGAIAAYNFARRPPDVHNANIEFKPKESKPKAQTVNWPLYGLNWRRTRYLAAKGIKPPFKKLWKYGDGPLLEFGPIFAEGKIFGYDNNGFVFALDADTGKVLWKRRVGTLNASSPTYSHHRLFIVSLTPGQILDLNPQSGKTEWHKALPGRSESAPVVIGNRVFFGDEDGTMYAVDRRNGHTIWTTQLCGAVKAAPAYEHGILFAGDYGGCMSAVNSDSGKIKWQSSSQGLGLGVTGQFYSTPAIAFGRVYTGNLDHRVYSFDEKTGELAWSHSTGGYVYGGPTVADIPGTGPTIYIGSVDGNVYALDAKNGDTRWSQPLGGQILGSTSAVGNIVYVGTYVGTTTYGFAMKDGRKVFTYGSGGANSPVISDGRRIYLTGYSSITALQPLTKKQIRGRAKARKEKEARKRKRQADRRKRKAQAKQRQKQQQQAEAGKNKPPGNASKGQRGGKGP